MYALSDTKWSISCFEMKWKTKKPCKMNDVFKLQSMKVTFSFLGLRINCAQSFPTVFKCPHAHVSYSSHLNLLPFVWICKKLRNIYTGPCAHCVRFLSVCDEIKSRSDPRLLVLSSVVRNSIPPRFVNRQLVAFCQLILLSRFEAVCTAPLALNLSANRLFTVSCPMFLVDLPVQSWSSWTLRAGKFNSDAI